MELVWTPRRQGDAGELSAMQWLVGAGATVWIPVLAAPDYDLIADFGDRLVRVQVKTSTCWSRNRFIVALCTRGGNQSWNGIVKRLDATRCDAVFVHVGDVSTSGVWSLPYVYLYALQIYLDFSAYTDIARGLGLLFGYRWPENFNLPYMATSTQDFWRRWHITLSRFLRDYLYVALGGNRRGPVRTYANLMLTMLLGGLWHGASWSFLLWGGLHGFFLVVNRLWAESKPHVGSTFHVVVPRRATEAA